MTGEPPAPDSPQWHERVAAIEAIATDTQLDHAVEMVLRRVEPHRYRASSVDGSVTFERVDVGGRYDYRVVATGGVNPLADQRTDRFLGHHHERDSRFPVRGQNSYPFAYDSIAQCFDSPVAPDVIVLATAALHSTYPGDHGSLAVVQARAPFIAAGAGVRPLGRVPRASRTVHVAPTVAALLGIDPHPAGVGPTGDRRADALLARQDGDPEADILTGDRADHVVVVLLDGANANLVRDAIESGEAPHLAGLVDRGVMYEHGLMASLPTATLANHTTAVTGAHPGHSGVLHNSWFDRTSRTQPDLLELSQMIYAARHVHPTVETLFEAVTRSRPDAFTTATFEFCDRGASFSAFQLLRDGLPPVFPEGEVRRHGDPEAIATSEKYEFMSNIDHLSASRTIGCWERTEGNPLPDLSWVCLALTDEAGHQSGPHGYLARAAVRDSDARLGDIIAAVDAAGVLERTAFVIIGDHGMEQKNPDVTLGWAPALQSEGHHPLDIDGLLYLTA